MRTLISLYAVLVLSFAQHTAMAATDQEAFWAETLSQSSNKNELIWLKQPANKVLALLIDDKSGSPQGAAIILHSAGAHPDWQEVIKPLRTALPEFGWITMAVQMPSLSHRSNLKNYAPLMKDIPARINAALKELASRGIQNIVLIGHGFGAIMGADYLAKNNAASIKAFIGISMNDYRYIDPSFDINQSLARITLPILDIYGSHDHDSVVKTAKLRADAARQSGQAASRNKQLNAFQQSATGRSAATRISGFIAYRRLVIAGADGSFKGFEPLLIKRIAGWLKQHAGGISLAQSYK